MPDAAAPAWVDHGSDAMIDGGARVFVGVGRMESQFQSATGKAIAKAEAQRRARVEVAKLFDTFVTGTAHTFCCCPSVDACSTPPEAKAARLLQRAAEPALHDVKIVAQWTAPDGDELALARLELDPLIKAVMENQELSASEREAFRAEVERAFSELLEERRHSKEGRAAP